MEGHGSRLRRNEVSGFLLAVWVSLLAILGLVLGCAAASRSVFLGQWAQNEFGLFRVEKVETSPAVAFEKDGAYYLIRPDKAEDTLVLVRVAIYNEKAGTALVDMQGKSTSLKDSQGAQYYPLALNTASVTNEAEARPHLRGELFTKEVVLPLGYQISGWILFQVSKERQLVEFQWDEFHTPAITLK